MKCKLHGVEVDPDHLKVGQTYVSFLPKGETEWSGSVYCTSNCFNKSRGGFGSRQSIQEEEEDPET